MDEKDTAPVLADKGNDFAGIDTAGIAADWGGIVPSSEPEEHQAEADPQKPDDQAQTDEKPAEQKTEPDAETKPEDKTDSKEADRCFTLKHLDEVKNVGKEEVIKLAQMGLDYERQRQKNTDLSAANAKLTAELQQNAEYAALLKEIGEPQGKTIEQVADEIRAGVIAGKEGITQEAALERIKAQREAKTKQTAPEKSPDDLAAEKRQTDIREFLAEYPAIDPTTIPTEVWESVRSGKSLLSAYQGYELKQIKADRDKLAADAEAARKNAENKAKTTGSKQSAGNKMPLDPITADWYS